MKGKRDLTIHFLDGSKLDIDFPKQTDNEYAAGIKLTEALAQRQLIVEADGALLVIPFENIKYMQAYPAPTRLPGYAIKAATFSD
jgi:hypothetical protein